MTGRVEQGRGDVLARAAALRAQGVGTVLLLDVAHGDERLHWLEARHARGWLRPGRGWGALEVARVQQELGAALAQGYVGADAAIVACLRAAGIAAPADGDVLPQLSWGEEALFARGDSRPGGCTGSAGDGSSQPAPSHAEALDACLRRHDEGWGTWGTAAPRHRHDGDGGQPLPSTVGTNAHPASGRFASGNPGPVAPLGLYPIVDSVDRLRLVLDAGARTVQLRIKTPPQPDAAWRDHLRREVADGIALARACGALLFINDHWALAGELGAAGVHLGQEDLLALGEEQRAALLRSGVALGVSSHSLWELCRARALAPRYVACGPVWPTTTKDMPWRPQGEDNLRWWCRVAGAPVVAIGGVLGAAEVECAAAWGADGVCLVRGLGERPAAVLPDLQAAYERGCAARDGSAPAWLHPSLGGPGSPTDSE